MDRPHAVPSQDLPQGVEAPTSPAAGSHSGRGSPKVPSRAARGQALTRWLELRIPSLPENVGIARVAVAALAGQLPFTLSELEEIKVAVSEAVTNAMVHGYGGPDGLVTVRAEHDGIRLLVEVVDAGRGIADVEQARQPAFSTDPERMGMGFAFMEAFMDRVEVESAPGRGTVVRMYKRPHPQDTAASLDRSGARPGSAPPDAGDQANREAAAGGGDANGDAGPDGATLR